MIRHHKTLVITLLTLAGAVYLSADAKRPRSTAEAAELVVKRVKVAPVEAAQDRRELRFSGITRAERRARLSFAFGGRITARPAEVGDRVGEGQLLARLDDLPLVNEVASARAALAELAARRAQTERDRDRAERLADAKAATGEELERTAAAVDALVAAEAAAAARLREAERRLSETRLTAPFAGTVTEVHFEPGEVALAGRPVVVLSGDGEIEVEVEVPESVIPRIAEGDGVEVLLPALGGEPLAGRVSSVGRTAAGPGQLFPVVVSLPPAERAAAGMSARVALRLVTEEALALPVAAVINPGGRRPVVFVVDGERARKVPVEVGTLLGDRVIVRGELAVGDEVVVGGQRGLLEGEAVEVVR